MAYGEKYYHPYCDSYGINCRLSIFERDWAGTSTEIDAAPIPFLKIKDSGTDFKFEPIRPTSGEANLIFGPSFDMEELWTADEKKYKLVHYVNGAVDWTGYVIPNGFAHEFKGGLYYAQIKASDGLNTLESIPFLGSDGQPYGLQHLVYNTGFQFPFILILTEILRKLDLDLNTWTCVDMYENSMVKSGDTRDAAPMANSYTSTKTYINDAERRGRAYWTQPGSAMMCSEILKSICIMFGAEVYQDRGSWKFKTVPASANFGSGTTQRFWHKFNTASVYLGREALDNEVTISCGDLTSAMIGTDHVMRMADVYKAFRVNYRYRYTREGDTPENLIKNGDFSDWNTSNTPGLTKWSPPKYWTKWAEGTNWGQRARPVDISVAPVGGYTTAIQIGTQYPGVDGSGMDDTTKPWNSIKTNPTNMPISVVKNDSMTLRLWVKWYQDVGNPGGNVYPAFRMILDPDQVGQANYYLRNNPKDQDKGIKGFAWDNVGGQVMENSRHYIHFILAKEMAIANSGGSDPYKWYLFDIDLPDCPVSGKLTFELMGLLYKGWYNTTKYMPSMKVFWPQGLDSERMKAPTSGEYIDNGGYMPRMQVTGVILSKIPDPSENAEVQDFIYDNPNANYTLEVDPLEVLNGDVNDPQHVSRIVVPSNTSARKNFWNTIDNEFDPASLGLIVVRRIMQQYIKPLRLLDGVIKAPGLTFDGRIKFEALPGRIFGILRGTINQKKNYLQDATFFEYNVEAIPPGGTEGGNNTDPLWIATGNIRCMKDGSNLNTGEVQRELVDANPNSATYNDPFWNPFGGSYTDLIMCPIGEPTRYLWGCDVSGYDPDNFTSIGFIVDTDPKIITCPFDNSGGLYIYFLHLASLSIVEHIFTDVQDEIISDFQYLADVTIDGYLYKVLRQNYVTADFNNLEISFKFL